jgi:hypothetical protein
MQIEFMTTESNTALITRLYSCFKESDGDGMAACYHPDATFSDPVFPHLAGCQVGDMWKMLNSKKADPSSRTFGNIHVSPDGQSGTAHWEAKYKFPLNGLPVHNIIEAAFEFKDGLIFKHTDAFDFYWWSRQAFGYQGFLLGWTEFFKTKVRSTLSAKLEAFVKSRSKEPSSATSSTLDVPTESQS